MGIVIKLTTVGLGQSIGRLGRKLNLTFWIPLSTKLVVLGRPIGRLGRGLILTFGSQF